ECNLHLWSPEADLAAKLAGMSQVGTLVAVRGEVREVPFGWRKCDGSMIVASQYEELSRVLGVAPIAPSGNPNLDAIGTTGVRVPDLRGLRYPHFVQHEGTIDVTMDQLFFGTYARNERDVEITWLIRVADPR